MAVVLPMLMSICWKIIVDQLGREVAHLKKPHPPDCGGTKHIPVISL